MSQLSGSDALVIAALAAGGYSLYKAMEEPTAVAGKPAPPPKPTSQKKPDLPVLNPPTNNPPSNNTINNNNNIINNIINPPVNNPPVNNPPVNNPPVNNPPVNNPPVNNPPFNNPPANNPPSNNPPVNNPPFNNPPANNPPSNNPPFNNPPSNNPPVNNPPSNNDPVKTYGMTNWFINTLSNNVPVEVVSNQWAGSKHLLHAEMPSDKDNFEEWSPLPSVKAIIDMPPYLEDASDLDWMVLDTTATEIEFLEKHGIQYLTWRELLALIRQDIPNFGRHGHPDFNGDWAIKHPVTRLWVRPESEQHRDSLILEPPQGLPKYRNLSDFFIKTLRGRKRAVNPTHLTTNSPYHHSGIHSSTRASSSWYRWNMIDGSIGYPSYSAVQQAAAQNIPNFGKHDHPDFVGNWGVKLQSGEWVRPWKPEHSLWGPGGIYGTRSVGSTLKKSKPQLMKLYRNEFPDLTVEVVERFTNSFNCIAWTIGVRDRWVWNEIDTNGDGLSSFSEFVSFYGRHGLLPTTVESEADVAIFGFESFGQLDVKHGAVREKGSNYWLSKMGQGGIIRHEGLNVFDTSPYGKLLLMFKRV